MASESVASCLKGVGLLTLKTLASLTFFAFSPAVRAGFKEGDIIQAGPNNYNNPDPSNKS